LSYQFTGQRSLCVEAKQCQKRPILGKKTTCFIGKRDLLTMAKETCCRGKRDLLTLAYLFHKRPTDNGKRDLLTMAKETY
jgi:hypothetical protein